MLRNGCLCSSPACSVYSTRRERSGLVLKSHHADIYSTTLTFCDPVTRRTFVHFWFIISGGMNLWEVLSEFESSAFRRWGKEGKKNTKKKNLWRWRCGVEVCVLLHNADVASASSGLCAETEPSRSFLGFVFPDWVRYCMETPGLFLYISSLNNVLTDSSFHIRRWSCSHVRPRDVDANPHRLARLSVLTSDWRSSPPGGSELGSS